jgi:S-adenosylmethionine/arginine decarboxylase-like enzyme
MDFHLHLLIDAEINNPPKDEQTAKSWLDRLVISLGMEKLGGPWATYCEDPDNRGLSGQIWLTTSHSSFHFWDNCDTPFVKLDVYSCKSYELETVLKLFEEFEPVKGSFTLINRSHTTEPPHITQGDILTRCKQLL